MPIYAYRCGSCGHAKDILQKMADPLLTVCPSCGEPAFQKQVTAAGFQLKGSGWYATDFRGAATASADTTKESASTVAAPSVEKKPEAASAAHSCAPGCASH